MADDKIVLEPIDNITFDTSDSADNDVVAHEIVDTEPDCATCVHQIGYPWGNCAAFPHGVPAQILDGTSSHKEPWPGGEELPVQYARRFA